MRTNRKPDEFNFCLVYHETCSVMKLPESGRVIAPERYQCTRNERAIISILEASFLGCWLSGFMQVWFSSVIGSNLNLLFSRVPERSLSLLVHVYLLLVSIVHGCASIVHDSANASSKPYLAADLDNGCGNGSKLRCPLSGGIGEMPASSEDDSSGAGPHRIATAIARVEKFKRMALKRSILLSGGAFGHERKATSSPIPSPSTVAQQLNRRSAAGTPNRSRGGWPEVRHILKISLARAGRGGLPGAAAGVLQVVTLMWLRTVVNYQCRYGTSISKAATELYRQGGVLRFYRGISFAIVSCPISRFGMAAANEGAIALTDALPWPVPVAFSTWVASLFAGAWRVMLTPLDTCKTVLQVEGPKGFALLTKKVWSGDIGCLYQGAAAAAAATAVGYFPWFLTFNYLNGRLKKPSAVGKILLRNAAIGLAASISSDMCSNSIRVLKTTKQAAAAYDTNITYRRAAALVIEADGWKGLMGRGLTTRILANGLQSMLFTVVWRYLHGKYIVPRREAAALQAKSAC